MSYSNYNPFRDNRPMSDITYEVRSAFGVLIREYQSTFELMMDNRIENLRKGSEKEAKLALIHDIIRFFDVTYADGEQILQLVETGGEDNIKLAQTMLFGILRNNLKSQILEELKKG